MTAVSLPERLYLHTRTGAVFPDPGLAVLAVSGGPDSVAMLDLFAALAPRLGLSLIVAHADHGIQAGSDTVAEQVAGLARGYGLECEVARLSLGETAGETRARLARYRFLRHVQHERGASYLVTAHHADDQIETVLMRALRGTGPAGLAGIPARGSRGLVRPLLPFRHAELLHHVTANRIPFVRDPANEDPRHLRSWMRATLLPLVRERLGDAAGTALLAVARQAAREVAAWDAALTQLPGLDVRVGDGQCDVARDVLSGYHNTLAERVLRAAATRAGLHVGPRAAARAIRFAAHGQSGRRLDLGDGLVAEVAFERLTVSRLRAEPDALSIEGEEGDAAFGAWRVQWRRESAPGPTALVRAGWVTWVAANGGRLCLRTPRPGDRLVPLGGAGRRRVARLLMEAKVARADRTGYPVIAADDVIWVPGVCRSGAELPAPGTPSVRIEVGRR